MTGKIFTHRATHFWGALLLAILLSACGRDVKVEHHRDSTSAVDTSAPRGEWIDTHGDPSKSDPGAPGDTSRGSSDRIPTASRNITISSPRPDDAITGNALTLSGTARTFENAFAYRVTGGDGGILAEGHSMAKGEMGHFNPYSLRVPLKPGYTGDALLEVFQFSAKDGSEIDKVSIPIRVVSDGTAGLMTLRIYLTNAAKGTAKDCRAVFARNRQVEKTVAVAERALNALLEGPSDAERREGYGSEIPAGTRLRDITIENGRAVADFSPELNRIAGACAVTAARSQIEQTLRQFPTVTSVTITVNGSPKEVLQP